jgi:tetratricopeptide (TPR) repeat protein
MDLVKRAQAAILDEYPPRIDLAKDYFLQAINQEPQNTEILDSAGEFLFEYDDPSIALQLLTQSIAINPTSNPSNYFILGQLKTGRDALEHFRKGLQLVDCLQDKQQFLDQAVSALVSIGELYMTELCDEPEAEEESENSLKDAIRLNPHSLEALNGLATFHKVVGELEEATRLCQQGLFSLKNTSSSYGVKMAFARTLIDIGMTDDGLETLHGLLDEDDEDVEVWFLVACCHVTKKDKISALETIKHAKLICQRDSEQKSRWLQELKKMEKSL